MLRLLIDWFEDSLQIVAGNLQNFQSHLERYFENSYSLLKKVSNKNSDDTVLKVGNEFDTA